MNQEEKLTSYLELQESSVQDREAIDEAESVIKSLGFYPISKEKLDNNLPSWTNIDLSNPFAKSDIYVYDKHNFALCNGTNGHATFLIPISSTIFSKSTNNYSFCIAALYASNNNRGLTVSLNNIESKNLICHQAQGIGFDVNTAAWQIFGCFECNKKDLIDKKFIQLKLESSKNGYWPHICNINNTNFNINKYK